MTRQKCYSNTELDNVESFGHVANCNGSVLDEERLKINRKLFNFAQFSKTYSTNSYVGFTLLGLLSTFVSKHFLPSQTCGKKKLYNRMPALKWLKNYKKEFFLPDLFSGITVGIMHIPQGMAYALLANVPPIYGLYTSFFPVVIYWIFGTSRQISLGTFAVVSLMAANTLAQLEPKYVPPIGFNASNITNPNEVRHYLSHDRDKAKIMILAANAFWIGVIQIGMSVFQLASITSYLSEPMINSFLVGAAFHVATSQLKFIFGISLTSYDGIGKIPFTYIELFWRISETNLASLVISIICMTILFLVKTQVNERFQKKLPAPFPIELVIVIFGTLISYLAHFKKKFDIKIIGNIQAGFPSPQIPPLFLIKEMFVNCFLMAIVAFVINFSLADLFARKNKYKINTTQELFAYGASNIFGSFYPCFCSGASLARSCVQNNTGGRTQLVSVYSSLIIAVVLLFIAPIFKELPQACLASIIVVALKTLFYQMAQLPYYWKINKLEFIQFVVTVLSVVFLDVDIGLAIGVGIYIILHIARSSQPYATLLGHVFGTELYKDVKLYKNARQLKKIRIVRIQQELHATNANFFKKVIYELTGVKTQDYISIKNKIEEYNRKIKNQHNQTKFADNQIKQSDDDRIKTIAENFEFELSMQKTADRRLSASIVNKVHDSIDEADLTEYEINERFAEIQLPDTESQIGADEFDRQFLNGPNDAGIQMKDYEISGGMNEISDENNLSDGEDEEESSLKMRQAPFKFLIIDFSPVNFIDSVGVKTINQVISDYNEIGIKVFLADVNDAVRQRVKDMEQVGNEKLLDESLIYMSIHDAVLYSMSLYKKIRKYQNLNL